MTLQYIAYELLPQRATKKAAEAAAVPPATPPAHGPAVDGGTIPAVVGEVLSQGAASISARYGIRKKHTLRYIAGPPAALRGTQPSQAIMLVKPSASGAKAAPAPVMQTNCRASVFSARQQGCALVRSVLLHRR